MTKELVIKFKFLKTLTKEDEDYFFKLVGDCLENSGFMDIWEDMEKI